MNHLPGLRRGLIAVAIIFAMVGLARGEDLIPPTPQEAEDIKTWIDVRCCRTAGCCRKVKPSALIPLSRDEYKVAITGQHIKRTGWSQDGQTWRCTCDLIEGQWVVHPMANTRCVFPVPNGY